MYKSAGCISGRKHENLKPSPYWFFSFFSIPTAFKGKQSTDCLEAGNRKMSDHKVNPALLAVIQAAVDMKAEKIKGYEREDFEEMLKNLGCKTQADAAQVTSNFKTVERINTKLNILGRTE